uniref:Phosphatidate phosphatase APP1 catalytic domain-containing protein n=1 Tax=Ditylum brightwellii TaxID=49249 RepID=A0A7S1YZE8_9STRA|mmetsp:Transcript_2078/g.3315  ORF Transcript_2078/g.3315 Transcript_2078/m.3315 type:complete len:437 (+) Transcript_2078:135-1445(+)
MAAGFLLPIILSYFFSTSSLSFTSTAIKNDERVLLFPTMATRKTASTFLSKHNITQEESYWEVPIHGWIFQPEETSLKRRAFLSLLRKSLDLQAEEESSVILKRRVKPFLVDNKGGKRLAVLLGEEERRTLQQRSKKNGHFKSVVKLSDEELCGALGLTAPSSTDGGENALSQIVKQHAKSPLKLQVRMVTSPVDTRTFTGTVHILLPHDNNSSSTTTKPTISVISDIDDTIKKSNVLQKNDLLRNTFLKEFASVPKMSSLYDHWQTKYQVQMFHYVSSSPWQLYEELNKFLKESKFGGSESSSTFHLKTIRLKDRSILNLLADPQQSKLESIENIFQLYYPTSSREHSASSSSHHQFVLVGDTGEKDPEVYGEIMRRYPQYIVAAFLRNVTGEKKEGNRLSTAFAGVGQEKWDLFHEEDEVSFKKMKNLDSWMTS